ncbi:MAG: relaxase/mobilization nuclease domain-containing protein, partial [Burkholderiaceae bacterium]|nr:relaxase/mobilization nuclease domain-containing protein [Burkholderiaceae bacterium]
MIAKHMPMRLLAKGNFSELISYLLDPQSKTERVGQVNMTNCHSDTAEVATLEVLNTQAMNQRTSADKTYHLMLSFRAGEQPDAQTLQRLEREVCAALGFAEHQRISVVHHDTDNLHVHIAINKIHPVRHTVHTPYNDYRTLARICEKLEKEYGLANDNHTPSKRGAEDRAVDMEQHAGVESLIGWIKRECWDDLRAAGTWGQLHQALRDNGLRLHLRANGLAITAADGTTIKASSLDRQFSKSRLEARLGAFVPG